MKKAKEKKSPLDLEVELLAQSGEFASAGKARGYVERKLAPLWRELTGLSADVAIEDELGLTEHMCKLLHLYGKAVHGHGRQRWHPLRSWAKSGPDLRPRALRKEHLAMLLAVTPRQIRSALDRFRGKLGGDLRLHAEHLAVPMYLPTGIMLDLAVSRQRLLFEYADYEYAEQHATTCRVGDATTNFQQVTHTRWAKSQLPVPEPSLFGETIENERKRA